MTHSLITWTPIPVFFAPAPSTQPILPSSFVTSPADRPPWVPILPEWFYTSSDARATSSSG